MEIAMTRHFSNSGLVEPRDLTGADLSALPRAMNSTSETITQVILASLVAGILLATVAWRSRSGVAKVFLGLAAACFLVPGAILFLGRNPWLIDARYRTFQLFYWNIRIGMSRGEVLTEMRNWYPTDQQRMAPEILADSAGRLEFRMNPESETAEDHEGILLKMQDGRVVEKSYEAE